jgi:hypothetical protein
MSINYSTLQTELQTDPTSLGYSPYVANGNDIKLCELMNVTQSGITVRRDSITSKEIVEAIDVADYTALPGSPTAAQLSSERRYLGWMQGAIAVENLRLLNDDGSNTPVVSNFLTMFPSGTSTRNRLLTLAVREGSRAEQLFGSNTVINPTDISIAMRGTK